MSESACPDFDPILTSAFRAYKNKTGREITSHPLAAELETCHSPDAILTVLRAKIPVPNQSQSSDERFRKWLIPTINVLYSFSSALGKGIGPEFPPAKAIFAGIGILLLAAKDVNASREALIQLFNQIELFFRRLEIYTEVPPTTTMTEILAQIMVEVLMIVGMATKEAESGRLKKYLKKLVGNTEIEDSLRKLDKLTQEEARMAAAEHMRITRSVEGKVMGVDDKVRGIEGGLQDVRCEVEGVSERVQGVDDKVEDVGKMVQDVDERVQNVGERVQVQVQDVNYKLNQADRNRLRDSLLRWLSPPDPSINQNIASKVHHNGTSKWFFQGNTFKQWKTTGSFLWIHGKPGSGKSVLCSSIIEDTMTLSNAGSAFMAYFYFDFRDIDKQKLRDLLPSLLIQLSVRSDPCRDVLFRLHSAHDRGEKKPSDRAMTECLKEMLHLLARDPTYIILDALDECPITSSIPSPREEVLDLVDQLVRLGLPNLHICVTSRPEFDIQTALEPLTSRPVSLHDETGQQQDITHYVNSFIYSDRRTARWREEDKDLVIKTLSEKADGMFRWAFCQLQVLRYCFPPSVRRILNELPDSLDETYGRVLREIKKANQMIAHRLLQCLVVAVRPLRVEELAEVLAFDFTTEGIPKLNPSWRWEDQEEAVMSACSSLVIVVKDGDRRIVQFSHFSVKEYLTSDRLGESSRDVSRYHILLEPAHTVLAQACLGLLLRLDDRADCDSIKGFPLARYAADYWEGHARFGSVLSRVEDGMKRLFDADKPHFATWLWIEDGHTCSTRPMSTIRPEKPAASPLYHAARLGLRNLLEHLVDEHPEDLRHKGGEWGTPLHISAGEGHIEVVSFLVEHFPNVDIPGKGGLSPLHLASFFTGHLEIGQLLLRHGADVNLRCRYGWTPLHFAAVDGKLEFVRMLLEHGAEIDVSNGAGETPLFKASKYGHVEVVRLLLEYGADQRVGDNLYKRPYYMASKRGYGQIMRLLRAAKPVKKKL